MDNTKLTELEIPETRYKFTRKLDLSHLCYAVVDDDTVFAMFILSDRARSYRANIAPDASVIDIRTGEVLKY